MKSTKFKIGIFIFAILTIAFFWGGNNEVVPMNPDEIHQDAGIINDVDSIDENNEETEEMEANIEQTQEDENQSTTLVDERPEVDQPIEKQEDTENIDTQKKDEEIETRIEEKEKSDKYTYKPTYWIRSAQDLAVAMWRFKNMGTIYA